MGKVKKVIMDQNNNINQKYPLYLSRKVIPFTFFFSGREGGVDTHDFLFLYIAF